MLATWKMIRCAASDRPTGHNFENQQSRRRAGKAINKQGQSGGVHKVVMSSINGQPANQVIINKDDQANGKQRNFKKMTVTTMIMQTSG